MLRDYQQESHDEAVKWLAQSTEPALIEAACGAGKSHIIAAIAETIHKRSKGKHILCLAPNAKLVNQNRTKYLATGNPASMFSASGGQKCLKHPVVFGTPGTVKNRISRFGSEFALVIIDECHEITPTIKKIIECMRQENPNLRVLGLTATPYRLGQGYIYAIDENNKPLPESSCKNPCFTKKLYTVPAHLLIGRGYLTPPLIGTVHTESYDTIKMQVNRQGKFSSADIDQAYHGHGRLTSLIIADIIENSIDRKAVMIFAATIHHAKECMASLPPGISTIITSEETNTVCNERIKLFESGQVKYMVNVAKYTTGFDYPGVDHIAILRATESVSLLQQIVGRGLRIMGGKADCLISDYANNIERHCPDGDIFNPDITAVYQGTESGELVATCPLCSVDNVFSARPNLDNFLVSESGYFLDLDGNEIKTDYGSMPAHFGRRCQALHPGKEKGKLDQCGYRWTFKTCDACDHDNDIAARYCKACKAEIIDPNEKLHIEFKRLKRDPTRAQVDKVIAMTCVNTKARSGKECLRINWVTEYRSFSIWLQLESTWPKQRHALSLFNSSTNAGQNQPDTITYVKDANTKFYDVLAYNQLIDVDLST